MRHGNGYRKLNRPTDQRMAMLSSITCSLLRYGKIKLTAARAREARKVCEHIITLAKKGDLSSRRKAIAIIADKEVVKKVFAEAVTRFGSRSGGYTRLIRLGIRRGDAAPVVLLELV